MIRREWKSIAYEMFFEQHKRVNAISTELEISQRTISDYLKGCDGFYAEKVKRKAETKKRQLAAQREWHAKQRGTSFSQGDIEGQLLRNEHAEAVRTLSYERIY